ncbi:hypothetical protein ACT453_17485, partial [Bacillus sp. D-CC]
KNPPSYIISMQEGGTIYAYLIFNNASFEKFAVSKGAYFLSAHTAYVVYSFCHITRARIMDCE